MPESEIPGRAPAVIDIAKIEKRGMPEKVKAKSTKDADRVTIAGALHLESCCDNDPLSISLDYSGFLSSSGIQPWKRKIKVNDQEWTPIDLGWVDKEGKVGMIVIKHQSPPLGLGQEDEKEPPMLHVSFQNGVAADIEIPPRQTIPLLPTKPHSLVLRASRGEITAFIHVLPR